MTGEWEDGAGVEEGPVFGAIPWLKTLLLSYQNIKKVSSRHFACLYNLQHLSLMYNHISTIEDGAFQHMSRQKTLNLGHNKISVLGAQHFVGLYSLETLVIEENPLMTIEPQSFVSLRSIKEVTLGVLNFPSPESLEIQLNLTNVFGGIPENLTYLSISSGRRPMTLIIGGNDVPNTALTLYPHLDIMFHNLTRLENLTLAHCWIHSLEKDLSKDLQSQRVLYLLIDNEFSVSESFFDRLRSLSYLIMDEPCLACSCDNAWLSDWVKQQRQVQVYLSKAIVCKNEDGIQSLSKYTHAHCFMDLEFLFFVSTSLVLLLFMLVVLLYKLAGEYLLAFFYIARGWVEEAMRRNKRGRYQFDAFVSYCGQDECWVVEELLPNLEQRGPPFLRLCLHARDFQPGKDIMENITDSLYRSRRTLCLVSRNFLRSNQCSLEMQLATHRLLTERRDILILVFLEKIPSRQLSAHHRLAWLVKTRTYINWPQDPTQREAFWDRLWAKLAAQV
ncbi:toll-like receptor 13 [Chanos chanos]|uniref:Toll-like receptor 13 n=1 Tax=Chanos chanos TaxID=29144 RepID=A0A6J2WZL2_CHACN|nr:toll-like receptor 13 [Chanos chanos]